MMPDPGLRVFITGASSGIGAALARAYARQGARVVLMARRRERLEALAAETGGLVCVGDVTREAEVQQAVITAREQLGGLDIVIANAGMGIGGNVEALTPEDYRRQFATNVIGVVATLQACLPLLRASRGRIAIVGSVAGTLPIPGSSAYCMSKAALRPLAESLGMELSGSGVSVTLVTPGFVASEIRQVDNAGVVQSAQADPVPSWLVMPAEQAATIIMRAIRRRRREVVVTWHGHVVLWLWRWTPWLARWILCRRVVRPAGR
jgi:short-subunit dehydrogenase